MLQLKQYAQLL